MSDKTGHQMIVPPHPTSTSALLGETDQAKYALKWTKKQ